MARAHVFKRLAGDRRAVSAVEFALIAPLLILAYVSSVHLTLALSADRKLTAAAATVADLVAQNETVTSAVINDIFEAGRVLVQPFPAGDLQMRITSVRADSNGVAQLVWSEGLGMGARSPGDLPSLPAGVLLPDSGLVVVEMSYPYDTPFTGVSFGNSPSPKPPSCGRAALPSSIWTHRPASRVRASRLPPPGRTVRMVKAGRTMDPAPPARVMATAMARAIPVIPAILRDRATQPVRVILKGREIPVTQAIRAIVACSAGWPVGWAAGDSAPRIHAKLSLLRLR